MAIFMKLHAVQYRPRGNAGLLQGCGQLAMIVGARPIAEERVDFLAMIQSRSPIDELRIPRPLGMLRHRAQGLPFGIVAYGDRDPTVLALALISVMRCHHSVAVPPLPAV